MTSLQEPRSPNNLIGMTAPPPEAVLAEAREMRSFGLLMASVLAGVFGLLLPWWGGRGISFWFLAIASAFAVTGVAAPLVLRPVFRVWMRVGSVLGWINSRILLSIVFYLLILPTAVILRCKGLDPMSRKLDRKTPSYRITSTYDTDIATSMERPF